MTAQNPNALTPSECGKLSRLSTQRAEIDEYAAQYRPKILERRIEHGYTFTKYEAGHAEGCECSTTIRPKGRNGEYSL